MVVQSRAGSGFGLVWVYHKMSYVHCDLFSVWVSRVLWIDVPGYELSRLGGLLGNPDALCVSCSLCLHSDPVPIV